MVALAVHVADATLATSERAALVDIYTSTNGQWWRSQLGWSSYSNASSDPCTWSGVTCQSQGGNASHVAQLVLASNNLTGTLPSSISSLSAMR